MLPKKKVKPIVFGITIKELYDSVVPNVKFPTPLWQSEAVRNVQRLQKYFQKNLSLHFWRPTFPRSNTYTHIVYKKLCLDHIFCKNFRLDNVSQFKLNIFSQH